MTGQELIDFIVNNHLEHYEVEVCHETGEGYWPVTVLEVNEEGKTVEVV